jgi:hypothetical protein
LVIYATCEACGIGLGWSSQLPKRDEVPIQENENERVGVNLILFSDSRQIYMERRLHVASARGISLQVEEKKSQAPAGIDRRAETRLRVNIPVEITWMGAAGQYITERTFIEDVSDFGCRFSTKETVKQGDTVSVQLFSTNGKFAATEAPKVFKVMWVSRKPHGMTVGARLLEAEKADNAKSEIETAPEAPPAK